MNKWRNYVVDGTEDLLFEECTLKNEIITKMKNTFETYDFLEIQTPTLEYYDVFNFLNKPIDEEKIYKFIDYKGRILTLRPDQTIPIARVFSNKIKQGPVLLSYCGQIFRSNQHLNGKSNEITQCGLEVIGAAGGKAEVLLLLTAIKALKDSGVDNFKLELGQYMFYESIFEELPLAQEEKEDLKAIIKSKNIGGLNKFLKQRETLFSLNQYKLLEKLPQLFGGKEVIEECEKLVYNEKSREALQNLKYVYESLESLGYGDYLSIDLALIQTMDYYTGIIFKGYVNSLGEEIISGGRYDSLLGEFGDSVPAAGLAINIDQITKLLKQNIDLKLKYSNKVEGIIFSSEKLFDLAIKLKNESPEKINWKISLEGTFEATLEYCYKNGINKAIKIEDRNGYYICDLNDKGIIERRWVCYE